jgi:hypothetical protein
MYHSIRIQSFHSFFTVFGNVPLSTTIRMVTKKKTSSELIHYLMKITVRYKT